jgi:multidrug efflux system membrane fusion protein
VTRVASRFDTFSPVPFDVIVITIETPTSEPATTTRTTIAARDRRRWFDGGRFITCLLLALVAAGCAAKPKPRSPRVPVTAAIVEQRSIPFALSSTGTVEPVQTAAVGSQVGGIVTRVTFREGDEVRKGQVLFRLDARPFHASLVQAQATLARDRAQAEAARLEAARAGKLVEQNVLSQAEWDQKRTTADALNAVVRADSAAAGTARLNYEYASIAAPISGRTGRLMVHEGDYIKSATSDPLVTINQIRPVLVRFTVPSNQVALVQRYRDHHPLVIATASASGIDSTAFRGHLVFVDNAVDPASGTLLLKAEFPNTDGRLVPGEFLDVKLVLYDEPNAHIIPTAAVSTGQKGTFVYVVNADSTVTPRPITVSRALEEITIVKDGLTPGEQVVTDGQLRLSPGAKVVLRTPGSRAAK